MSIRKIDEYRFILGPGIMFNPVADDGDADSAFSGVQLEAHLAFKVRFFNPSRRARNKFAFEFGPTMDVAIAMSGGADIGVESNLIFKFNKWFGAGIFVAPNGRLGSSDKTGTENGVLPLVKAGGEVQFYKDMVRLRGGIIATDSDARHMGSFAQFVFDLGAVTMAFVGK